MASQISGPYSQYDWVVEHFGLLFTADTPMQQISAWVMLLAIASFPVWIIGAFLYQLVRRRWFYLRPTTILATSLHVGLLKPAPGTWGSLFTAYLLVWLIFAPRATTMDASMIPWIVFISTVVVSAVGTWAADVYAKKTGGKDPSEVVIDEVAGMLVTTSIVILGFGALIHQNAIIFMPLLYLWPAYLTAIFFLFRLFDIWKPGPIGKLDRDLTGGWGIMADDLLAGVFAGGLFWVIFLAMHYSGVFLWIFKTWFPDWVGPAPEVNLPMSK